MRIASILLVGAAFIAGGGFALAAPTDSSRGEQRLAAALEGRVAGKPVDCISLRYIRSSEIIDRTAILYRTIDGRLYVNRPRSGQRSLKSSDILVTKTTSSEICSIDTVRLYDSGSRIENGFVRLGKFVPYNKVAISDRS
jgi:hypothetical protein